MRHTFSTQAIAANERLEYWRKVAKEVLFNLDIGASGHSDGDFSGSITSQPAGKVHIYEINADAHEVYRSITDVEAVEEPRFTLILQGKGECAVEQDGRNGSLSVGDFALLDATRKFELRFPGQMQQFVVSLPQDVVRTALMSPEQITGLAIDGNEGVGRIASQFMRTFIDESERLPPHTLQGLTWAMLEILNAAAVSLLTGESRNSSRHRAFQVHQIRLYIEENLRDPELTPSTVAAAHHISQRYLNKLFEGEDATIGRLIRNRRLDRCHQDLQNPALAEKPISQIAYSWGFNNPSHFSRSFKERFGTSPQAVREGVPE